jgi:hypothetical protein
VFTKKFQFEQKKYNIMKSKAFWGEKKTGIMQQTLKMQ